MFWLKIKVNNLDSHKKIQYIFLIKSKHINHI